MIRTITRSLLPAAFLPAVLLLAGCATTGGATEGADTAAQAADDGSVSLVDPAGDDFGPGTYVYPTDAVYKPGAFDITGVEVVPQGDDVEFRVSVDSRIEDPWDSQAWGGNGFSVQMAFFFIDQGEGGVTKGLPGLNVRFPEDQAWDKVVILSPQGPTRVSSEIEQKASDIAEHIVVPRITRASGRTLIAVVPASELGGMPEPSWGYQVLMQSNEGFPAKTDLLTRKVNEYEGQHRFGGGTDYDNDPHVIDMLAGNADGSDDEVEAQKQTLGAYDPRNIEPAAGDLVAVPMVYPNR